MSRVVAFGELTVHVDDVDEMVRDAAVDAAAAIRAAIIERGEANVMLATGNSQLAFLVELVQMPDIAWDRVARVPHGRVRRARGDALRELPALHA